MTIYELADAEDARRYLLQGLWLQRVLVPHADNVRVALEWAMELAGEGSPVPPVGFVADVGHLVFGTEQDPAEQKNRLHVPGEDAGKVRAYEDYVLGKLYADSTFERAADAVLHYQGRDQARGLRYLIERFGERAGFGGAVVNPAVVKHLQRTDPEEVLSDGWQSLAEEGLDPLLTESYDHLVKCVRNVGDVLAPEDVFELEHRTALAEFGQRLALRQTLRASAELSEDLPLRPPTTKLRRFEVPTRIQDEDNYPIGGFSSISNKGSIESLLHSQLAYMEADESARPDLFDVKFLRDELLYYSRDENQFLRRRRTFVFALFPDLAQTRVKDGELPFQRIVMLLGLLVAAVRRTIEWLDDESLLFEILLLDEGSDDPLPDERELLEMVFREQIANGTVSISTLSQRDLAEYCQERSRRSTCHCVAVSTKTRRVQPDNTLLTRIKLPGAVPAIGFDDERPAVPESESPLQAWQRTAEQLLQDFATT